MPAWWQGLLRFWLPGAPDACHVAPELGAGSERDVPTIRGTAVFGDVQRRQSALDRADGDVLAEDLDLVGGVVLPESNRLWRGEQPSNGFGVIGFHGH